MKRIIIYEEEETELHNTIGYIKIMIERGFICGRDPKWYIEEVEE